MVFLSWYSVSSVRGSRSVARRRSMNRGLHDGTRRQKRVAHHAHGSCLHGQPVTWRKNETDKGPEPKRGKRGAGREGEKKNKRNQNPGKKKI